jgi:DNA-binding beta-propeller fold protein YncE
LNIYRVRIVVVGLLLLSGSPLCFGQDRTIPLEPGFWNLDDARVVEQAGRRAVTGLAVLKDVVFEDGVIEFDVWAPDVRLTGGRAYPGVLFRMQSRDEAERLYIRPHRAGLYADAVQYTPVFNGVAGWQLYNGDGFTGALSFPFNEWVPVRIEVSGRQALVFVGNLNAPCLAVHDLKHGISRGAIALYAEGAAFFSHVRVRTDETPKLPPPPPANSVPGAILDWELSQGFPTLRLETDHYPDAKMLAAAAWTKVAAEPSGLVDIARTVKLGGSEPKTVLARTLVFSDGSRTSFKLDFGYSDAVDIFLNGRLLFSGDSSYRLRDSSFLGIVGYWDSVNLPLRQGANELLLAVSEGFGGWGFMARDASAVFAAPRVVRAWQTAKCLNVPESAACDPVRKVAYVSIYDPTAPSQGQGRQAIARISLDGRTIEPAWIPGLNNPTGLAVRGDTLYAVERTGLAEIDIPSGTVVKRTPVPSPIFLNDVAVDPDSGRVFISDSAKNAIFLYDGPTVAEWISGADLPQPNGLLVRDGRLIVGTSGDGCLKAVDLKTRAVTLLARLGAGIVDGIAADENGAILVSHNEGRLFRVTADGGVAKILDTTTVKMNLADFDYCPAAKLIVVPTYTDCRVATFKLE